MFTIENKTTRIFEIYFSAINVFKIYPGFNLNVSEENVNNLKTRVTFKALIEKGLIDIKVTEEMQKVKTDKETNVSYIEDTDGEKVPVFEGNSPLATGVKYTADNLKEKNIPTRVIAKLIENQPPQGWGSINQIVENLGFNSKQQEIIESNLGADFTAE